MRVDAQVDPACRRGTCGSSARSSARRALVLSLAGLLGACGPKFAAEVENQANRTIYIGIIERTTDAKGTNTAARVVENASIKPGETVEITTRAPGVLSGRASYTLMVGDTPSPRGQGILLRLDKGDNGFLVRLITPDPKSPIFVERLD